MSSKSTHNIYKDIFDEAPVPIIKFDYSAVTALSKQLEHQTVTNIRQFLMAYPNEVKKTYRKVKILEANQAALELFESKTIQGLWKRIYKIFSTSGFDSLMDQFISLLEGEFDFEGEIKFKTLQRKFHDVHWHSRIPAGSHNTYSEVISVFQDISSLQKLIRQLRNQAQRDGLTKLLNHNTIMHRLDEELTRAKRYGLSLSCLMIDLDHFKVINDKFGHQKGDQVLKRVATLIKSGMRTVDLVGRYGGDEFLIILPETVPENAKIAAMRIQNIVTSKLKKYQTSLSIPLSVSIGITGYPSKKVKDSKDLIAYADKGMYQAKKAGRNRISAVL